jgi:hypothetical protein
MNNKSSPEKTTAISKFNKLKIKGKSLDFIKYSTEETNCTGFRYTRTEFSDLPDIKKTRFINKDNNKIRELVLGKKFTNVSDNDLYDVLKRDRKIKEYEQYMSLLKVLNRTYCRKPTPPKMFRKKEYETHFADFKGEPVKIEPYIVDFKKTVEKINKENNKKQKDKFNTTFFKKKPLLKTFKRNDGLDEIKKENRMTEKYYKEAKRVDFANNIIKSIERMDNYSKMIDGLFKKASERCEKTVDDCIIRKINGRRNCYK